MKLQKLIGISVSSFLVASSVAHADTYNFFFDEAKKKKTTQEESPAPEENPAPQVQGAPEAVVQIPVDQPEMAGAPVGTISGSPLEPTAPVATASVAPVVPPIAHPTSGGSPITIHNNITFPGIQPTPPPTVVAPQSPSAQQMQASGSVTAVVTATSYERKVPRWKVGFGPMLTNAPHSWSYYDGNTFHYDTYRRDRPALVLSLGYRLAPALAMNTFMGLHQSDDWNPVFGADLELIPIRVNVGHFDLFELAVLGGVSNILTAVNSGGIVPHAGARLNINLGSNITLTTAMRVAEQFRSAEWSLAFNI
jgi:hypothetical protein